MLDSSKNWVAVTHLWLEKDRDEGNGWALDVTLSVLHQCHLRKNPVLLALYRILQLKCHVSNPHIALGFISRLLEQVEVPVSKDLPNAERDRERFPAPVHKPIDLLLWEPGQYNLLFQPVASVVIGRHLNLPVGHLQHLYVGQHPSRQHPSRQHHNGLEHRSRTKKPMQLV